MPIIFPLKEKVVKKHNRNFVLIKAICDYCEKEFFAFKSSQKNKNVFCCRKCSDLFKLKGEKEFLQKCKEVHGENNFDYSFVKYGGCFVQVKIKCKKCKRIFTQTPANHIQGSGCPFCAKKYTALLKKEKTIENFLKLAPIVHGDFYDYSLVTVEKFDTQNRKVEIICPKHGAFQQRIDAHLRGQRCKKCQVGKSKGEDKIEKLLKKRKIKYKIHHTFEDCKSPKTNYHLYFDFWLPDNNVCIEFNGKHHYEPVNFNTKFFNENYLQKQFENQTYNDEMKKEYCKTKNIKLIIIPYWDFDKIEKKLEAICVYA